MEKFYNLGGGGRGRLGDRHMRLRKPGFSRNDRRRSCI